jgi:hypothetical protein
VRWWITKESGRGPVCSMVRDCMQLYAWSMNVACSTQAHVVVKLEWRDGVEGQRTSTAVWLAPMGADAVRRALAGAGCPSLKRNLMFRRAGPVFCTRCIEGACATCCGEERYGGRTRKHLFLRRGGFSPLSPDIRTDAVGIVKQDGSYQREWLCCPCKQVGISTAKAISRAFLQLREQRCSKGIEELDRAFCG